MSFHCNHKSTTSCTLSSAGQVGAYIAQAETLCKQRQQRFTRLRRTVLELVCHAGRPVAAYSLLDPLKARDFSPAPPTVYRALDFLLEQGLVHRLATNNTYIACAHPERAHSGVFLVCRDCGNTQEIHNEIVSKAVCADAIGYGFQVEGQTVEVSGLCEQCQALQDEK